MNQIALPLDWQTGEPGNFLVSPSNAEAVHLLDHWGGWPVRAAILAGPPRSGRSLLARLFAANSGGRVIDDADGADETALFHAWNAAQATRRPVLFVAAAPPPAWRVTLPDLASRLAASPRAVIAPPDDALVAGLIAQGFERRRLVARADLIDWLAARVERSHAAVERAVLLLDRAVTERQRRLSIPLARDTLGDTGLIASMPEKP